MNTEQIRRMEKLLDRELSGEEKERLGRIQGVLKLTDSDALWDVLAALEYQRTYYEELPTRVAAASTEILQGITLAAEKEAERAQSLLAESVVEQAKKMSLRLNVETLLPMGLVALVCQLLYGSLLMWAGFLLGTGEMNTPVWLLRMPSGFIMAGLCMAGGLYLGVHAGWAYADEAKGWLKKAFVALVMLIAGGAVFGHTL
jgi:hypothetical protein